MQEPSLAFQTGVRTALIASADVLALVPADNVRSGSTRPNKTPCIILSGASTEFLGHASGSQYMASVSLDLHIWAIEDGADTSKAIGFAASKALITLPRIQDGFEIDALDQPSVVWLRDPQPELAYTHGILNLEAVIRWKS